MVVTNHLEKLFVGLHGVVPVLGLIITVGKFPDYLRAAQLLGMLRLCNVIAAFVQNRVLEIVDAFLAIALHHMN